MADTAPHVPSWCLTDVLTAREYLLRQDELDDKWIAIMLRGISARIERHCARKLKSRPYAAASSTSVTSVVTTLGGYDLNRVGGFVNVLEGTIISGTPIATDSLVAEKRSNDLIIMSKPAIAAGTTTLTFSQPDTRMRVSGAGDYALYVTEWPLDSVTALSYIDDGGVSQTLSLTNAVIGRDNGMIRLPGAVFPTGIQNIVIECVAGYRPGVDDAPLWQLEQACLKWLQVEWQNFQNQPGRRIAISEGSMRTTLSEVPMPNDVRNALASFLRYA